MFHPYIKDICNPCHDKDHNKQYRGTQWDVQEIKYQMNKLFRGSSSQWKVYSQKRLDYMAKTQQKIFENQVRKTERLTFGIKEEFSKRLPSCSPGCLDSFGLVKFLYLVRSTVFFLESYVVKVNNLTEKTAL